MPVLPTVRPTRRQVLQGGAAAAGALVLGTYVTLPRRAFAQAAPAPINYDPNVFLRIGEDDSVTVEGKLHREDEWRAVDHDPKSSEPLTREESEAF